MYAYGYGAGCLSGVLCASLVRHLWLIDISGVGLSPSAPIRTLAARARQREPVRTIHGRSAAIRATSDSVIVGLAGLQNRIARIKRDMVAEAL